MTECPLFLEKHPEDNLSLEEAARFLGLRPKGRAFPPVRLRVSRLPMLEACLLEGITEEAYYLREAAKPPAELSLTRQYILRKNGKN